MPLRPTIQRKNNIKENCEFLESEEVRPFEPTIPPIFFENLICRDYCALFPSYHLPPVQSVQYFQYNSN